MIGTWANPVWYFFHGLAEKVDPTFFNANRGACLKLIKDICQILPCPMCRVAATRYMQKITVRHIPTKEVFKDVIFKFHNYVNKKTYKRQFPKENLKIYKRLRFIKTTQEMCYQLKRFNRGGLFRLRLGNNSDQYINQIENSVRAHIKYFI